MGSVVATGRTRHRVELVRRSWFARVSYVLVLQLEEIVKEPDMIDDRGLIEGGHCYYRWRDADLEDLTLKPFGDVNESRYTTPAPRYHQPVEPRPSEPSTRDVWPRFMGSSAATPDWSKAAVDWGVGNEESPQSSPQPTAAPGTPYRTDAP